MRSLSLIRITASRSVFPINFALNNTTMNEASDAEKRNQSGGDSRSLIGSVKKEVEKFPVKIPPPPEKPLPGDCCGSGCVRCVWDIYYEELEEYNNLYKNKSDPDPIKP